MEYDFAGLSADLLFKLEKRLNSFSKSVLKDFNFALNIINSSKANEERHVIDTEMNDLLRDQANKSIILYTETFNKLNRLLEERFK